MVGRVVEGADLHVDPDRLQLLLDDLRERPPLLDAPVDQELRREALRELGLRELRLRRRHVVVQERRPLQHFLPEIIRKLSDVKSLQLLKLEFVDEIPVLNYASS